MHYATYAMQGNPAVSRTKAYFPTRFGRAMFDTFAPRANDPFAVNKRGKPST